ncbi:MAG: DUF5690 family protein [Tannerellaceae bacterium]|jgi:hypothetical protein|nr:DUF5690 family protein [Tannerellaceae bacterium]
MLERLLRKDAFLIIWCIVAAFGVYFCTYAFRKPFNAGTYEGYTLFGIGYKTILIISQMLGYIISKFSGIKFISELKPQKRIVLILCLVGFSGLALIGFGLVPYSYGFICLFLNGLPLGLIFGIVFSFLEGRRFTEMLSLGLSISMIIGSGILKSAYFFIQRSFHVDEFWMPAVEGLVFVFPFLLFLWMLSRIPMQNTDDIAQRTKREPMTKKDKRGLIRTFGVGIFCIVAINALLTLFRDFRDDFMVEIAHEIGIDGSMSIFSAVELGIGLFVLFVIGLLSFFRSNKKSFVAMHIILLTGLLLLAGSSIVYINGGISPLSWFICNGCGVFLSYIVIQSVYFDRFIALFRVKANAGFLIYICDSAGYVCSALLLCYREFFVSSVPYSKLLLYISLGVSITGIICLLIGGGYLFTRLQYRNIHHLKTAYI